MRSMGWHTLLSQRVSPDQLVRMLAQLRERALDRPGESRCVLGRLTTVRGSKGVWVRRVELLGLGPPRMAKRGRHIHGKAWWRGGKGVARAWEGLGRGGNVPLEVVSLKSVEPHGITSPVGKAHRRRAGAGVEAVRDDGATSGDEDLDGLQGGCCGVIRW